MREHQRRYHVREHQRRWTTCRGWMSLESGTVSGQQEAEGRPTQRAAQKWTTTQRAAQSGQQEAAEGPTQETHRQDCCNGKRYTPQQSPLRYSGMCGVLESAFTRYSFTSKLLCTSESSFSCPSPSALPTLLQYKCTPIAQYKISPQPRFCMPYTNIIGTGNLL